MIIFKKEGIWTFCIIKKSTKYLYTFSKKDFETLTPILKEYMNIDLESHKTSCSILNTDVGDRGLLIILYLSKFIDGIGIESEKILEKIKFHGPELENIT